MRLLALLFTAASVSGWGQSQNLPRFDQKPLHFGFFLGISQLDFAVQHNPNWPEGIWWGLSVGLAVVSVGLLLRIRFVRRRGGERLR